MASEQVVLLLEFAGLAMAAAGLIIWQQRHATKDPKWAPIRRHSNSHQDQLDKLYLIVYLLVAAGDALQAMSLHSLYSSYGYGAEEIRTFSIVSLAAAAVPGVVLASYADTYGRRKGMLLFGILYLVATTLTTDSSMSSLVASRLFAGVAAALLGSVFESWLVRQHRQSGFHMDLLSLSFSAITTWAGLTLVLAQVVGLYARDLFGGLGPIYISGLVTGTGLIVISAFCSENYGDKEGGWQLPTAIKEVVCDRRLRALAVSQTLIESGIVLVAMTWPTSLGLQPATRTWVSNYFVICTVIGSVAFAHVANGSAAITKVVPYISVMMASALALAAYFSQFWIRVAALLVFQVGVGLYWPSQATLRCSYISEARRTSTLALFRCPVAFVQIAALLYMERIDNVSIFWLSSSLVALASLYQQISLSPAESNKSDAIIAVDTEMATA